ncbi:DUF559 domain-containing protein [Sulfobacillus thermosulfidooxidans]|uniref:DUF559 domain-containing protein n=1 Tax=Sulfobacillus thermosulfidooxidans TaxID=28034 RepID=UPI003D6D288E
MDGGSHYSIKTQQRDFKKNQWLSGNGWIVLRCSNRTVMNNLSGCVQMVQSIIWRLKNGIPIQPTESLSITVITPPHPVIAKS